MVLSGEDPAAQELLALLGSQTYDVGYEVGAIEGHAVPLDYTITLILTMEPEEEGASAPFLYFDGSDEATMDGLDKAAGSNGWVRTHYRVDLAFQQEILDLLLAQPYEKSFRRKASSLTATHPLPPLRGTKRKETHHEKTNQRRAGHRGGGGCRGSVAGDF